MLYAKKWKVGESATILQKWAAVLETLEPFTVETIDAAIEAILSR